MSKYSIVSIAEKFTKFLFCYMKNMSAHCYVDTTLRQKVLKCSRRIRNGPVIHLIQKALRGNMWNQSGLIVTFFCSFKQVCCILETHFFEVCYVSATGQLCANILGRVGLITFVAGGCEPSEWDHNLFTEFPTPSTSLVFPLPSRRCKWIRWYEDS